VKNDTLPSDTMFWNIPTSNLSLGDEIHVWCICLDIAQSYVQHLYHVLSLDEKRRGEEFCFQKDQEHFIVAHGLLRLILAHYLRRDPRELRFCCNYYGKPSLDKDSCGGTLNFNLSHSHGIALLAVARGRDIGIDLERIRDDLEDGQIAEHFFSHREVAMLRVLPLSLRKEAFFTCWTRKEAYAKARGLGLSLPLDQFTVSLAPGEPAMLLDCNSDPNEVARWTLRTLPPIPGYAAAFAVERCSCQLKYWRWVPSWKERATVFQEHQCMLE